MNFVFDRQYSRCARKCLLVLAAIGLSACVTINIYFPAAAAEKAADKVIDEIWQTPAGQTNHNTTPAATPAIAPSINQESAP